VKVEAMEGLERECLVPVRLDDAVLPIGFRHVHAGELEAGSNLSSPLRDRIRALAGTPASPAVSTKTALAVLPFENLSGDPSKEYFSDGVTEALITSLAQISALKVISRTSVTRFKNIEQPLREVARDLGVTKVIRGSVIASGSRVRISVQLIDAFSDTHDWAESFDRDLIDVLAIHDEIAQLVANGVRVRLTTRETARLASSRRVDPDAHDRYLRGMHEVRKLTRGAMTRGITLLEESIRMDPEFAVAHAALALAIRETELWGHLYTLHDPVRARQAAMASLLIDPDLAEGHHAMAGVEQNAWTWASAEREYKSAIALNPSFADAHRDYAFLLIVMGRPDEAVEAARRACTLAPLAPRFHDDLGRTLYRAGRYAEAIEQHRRALELDADYMPPHPRILETQLELGELDRVEQALSTWTFGELAVRARAQLAVRRGAHAEVHSIAKGLLETGTPWSTIGAIELLALAGELDAAMDALERAVQTRAIVPYMLRNPSIRLLRGHPRYSRLMELIGLPP
jgi:TolB-like protein/Tfp pilus assembly protein PilF